MNYRLVNNLEEGWRFIKDGNKIGTENGFQEVLIEINEDEIETKQNGETGVVIERGNQRAKLKNGSRGKIRAGDVLWLLSSNDLEDFSKGTIRIEIVEEESEEKKKGQDIFIKERSYSQEKSNRKINLFLGIIVFLLLLLGTFLGYQKRNNDEQDKKYKEINEGVEMKIKEAEGVKSINIETALKLVEEAEKIINEAGVAQKKYSSELNLLNEKVKEIKKSLGGEKVDYEVAYDTSLISEGEDLFNNMAAKNGVAYVLNRSLGQINMIDLKLKSTEKIISDEKIKGFLGMFYDGKKWWGFDANNVYEIRREGLVGIELKDIGSIGGMAGWSETSYVVDNGKGNILKLNGGQGKNWLKEGTSLGEEITGISIDSNIWTLGKSGKIYKYNRGEIQDYKMSSMVSLSSAKLLKTNDKVNFLAYITDENTVVIYGKDGKILGKYYFSGTKINDIDVDEINNGVLVLAKNGKIYQIKL